MNVELRAAYEELVEGGDKNLHYVRGEDILAGEEGEGKLTNPTVRAALHCPALLVFLYCILYNQRFQQRERTLELYPSVFSRMVSKSRRELTHRLAHYSRAGWRHAPERSGAV
jgi:hypothetical protein